MINGEDFIENVCNRLRNKGVKLMYDSIILNEIRSLNEDELFWMMKMKDILGCELNYDESLTIITKKK